MISGGIAALETCHSRGGNQLASEDVRQCCHEMLIHSIRQRICTAARNEVERLA